MGKIIDITGQKFGKLTVISLTDKKKNDGCAIWECQCECGNMFEAKSTQLRGGFVTNCGCDNPNRGKLENQRFSRLTVKRFFCIDKHGKVVWECLCDCGNISFVNTSSLTTGNTKSCGCINKEHPGRTKHNMSHTPEYNSFAAAKERCNNPNTPSYNNYGGRGIKFLWDTFEEFYRTMGPRPAGTSLDRIDNNGNYENGNCRWATNTEQTNNARSNIKINIDGVLKTLAMWADEFKLNKQTVYTRYSEAKDRDPEILFRPSVGSKHRSRRNC